ncbi:hypothetical protein [Actinomadura rubrisoli]|uniref:Uncharacterized protein n=1 Tax=Actinomadura rubrisoli TaxID=2530368 RepID=A0A4R5AAA9_9ACTN|nr:hypothetical protein [Actinomadura rubrisoli]TDD68585.1 hypothetical protein E1298_38285 [Actinomadura rubrisoli]
MRLLALAPAAVRVLDALAATATGTAQSLARIAARPTDVPDEGPVYDRAADYEPYDEPPPGLAIHPGRDAF